VFVFITAGPSTKMFTWGGGGYGRTCATRDDEPRPVWTSLPIGGDMGGHVLRERQYRVCVLLQDLVQSSVCLYLKGVVQ
jgi:hypothetical protein